MSVDPEDPHRGRVLGWSIILLLIVLTALFVLCVGPEIPGLAEQRFVPPVTSAAFATAARCASSGRPAPGPVDGVSNVDPPG